MKKNNYTITKGLYRWSKFKNRLHIFLDLKKPSLILKWTKKYYGEDKKTEEAEEGGE